ncbi:hypothetical protein V6N13_032859 [Hibiscus sabdariffa]
MPTSTPCFLPRPRLLFPSFKIEYLCMYTVTYQFEIVQTLLFRVFDVDTQFHNVAVKMLKLEEQQYLGEASCALSEIVSKANRSLTLDLVQREEYVPSTYSQHRGKLTVHAEEVFSSKTTTEMTLKCLNLESKDLFSKSVCIADFIFS